MYKDCLYQQIFVSIMANDWQYAIIMARDNDW